MERPIELSPQRLLDLHSRWPERYPALFESAANDSPQGRYDILFACPQAVLRKTPDASFLDALDRQWQAARAAAPATLTPAATSTAASLPFTGGWLVFLGYEIAAEIEPTLRLPASPESVAALALRIPAAVVFDHRAQKARLVAEAGQEALLDEMARDVRAAGRSEDRSEGHGETQPGDNRPLPLVEDDPAHFIGNVRSAKARIAAGDIYQANLSRAWRASLREEGPTATQLYRRLRRANPAPFAASFRWEDFAVLSSSPERLLQIREGWISTRPIAGTRPRSLEPGADATETSNLVAHPKERAEHVMLIDLERNDLGRICEAGTVKVDEFMATESYSHVHHIVSNVRGRLLPDMTPGKVLRAVFPGGTITGCPKVRCMQIIAELEGVGRGAYTGSLGYLNHDGTGDFNILIRTLVLQARRLSFRAGAGIVADSEPEKELEETRAKAKGLLRALNPQ